MSISRTVLRLACVGVWVTVGATGSHAFAQGQPPQPPPHEHPTPDSSQGDPSHQEHVHPGGAGSLFASREASGTAWLPDATPMYGSHLQIGAWELMLHGNVFAQLLYEPGYRHRTGGFSKTQVSSVNWGMLMARRALGTGRVGLRAMASVEPWTVSSCGFLNFLATGESCEGDTIHDRQHPHDLFMELAAEYDRPLRGTLRWQIYGGLAGEPALGPVGFPHRLTAMPNPVAPIGHHWLDSSHITFGLITAGVYGAAWKAEMSIFNGREPDEGRFDIDLAPLDSFSGRLSWLPTNQLAFQVSAAHLNEAELDFESAPRTDLNRVTASATYHRPLDAGGMLATTLAYGINSGREFLPTGPVDAMTQALTLEGSLTLRGRHTWFARGEVVEKPAHDLHAHEFGASVFTVGKLQIGYVRSLADRKGFIPGIGVTGSLSLVPPALAPRYGTGTAPGFGVFLSVRPSQHTM
jgi:hypothetical protein